ncbi:MAG: GlsB/YeaQ/YmgE family stress response membrane protein [Xanthobacteraceae bacterium]
MEQYAVLNQPGVGFFMMLIIGLLAGWIAEKVTASDHGLLTNLLVGIAGAFVGGKIAELLEVPVFGFFRTLIAASVGAVLLLWLWRALRGQSSAS